MCTFTFHYADGNDIKCEHIKSVTYSFNNKRKDVSEEELATYPFPITSTLRLFTESGSFCVSGDGLRFFEVKAE